MHLGEYPVESITFTGLGAEGDGAQAAAEALAAKLNAWASQQSGRRLLEIHTTAVPVRAGAGLAAILAHTAGPDLSGELAEQVAQAVEDALPVDLRGGPAIEVTMPQSGLRNR